MTESEHAPIDFVFTAGVQERTRARLRIIADIVWSAGADGLSLYELSVRAPMTADELERAVASLRQVGVVTHCTRWNGIISWKQPSGPVKIGVTQRTAACRKPPPDTTRLHPLFRRCLMCDNPFDSGWDGERVCKRCKQSTRWKEGCW